jgi:hypothetical protein
MDVSSILGENASWILWLRTQSVYSYTEIPEDLEAK